MGFFRSLYALLNWEYEGEKERKIIEKQSRLKFVLNQQIIKTKDINKITTKNKKTKFKPIKLSEFLKSPTKS